MQPASNPDPAVRAVLKLTTERDGGAAASDEAMAAAAIVAEATAIARAAEADLIAERRSSVRLAALRPRPL